MVRYFLHFGTFFRAAGGYILPDFPDVRPELPEFPALEGSLCATLLVHKVEACRKLWRNSFQFVKTFLRMGGKFKPIDLKG